jgi:hypothetical protein
MPFYTRAGDPEVYVWVNRDENNNNIFIIRSSGQRVAIPYNTVHWDVYIPENHPFVPDPNDPILDTEV